MPSRVLSSLFAWGGAHRPQIGLANAAAVTRFGSGIAYVVLTVMVARSYGAWTSGLVIGGLNFFQALVTDPLAGGLADRIGSKATVLIGSVLLGLAGLVWLALPGDDLFLLVGSAILLFAAFSCRDEIAAYLLRMSARNEGGLVFGVAENIFATLTFLSTLAAPLFLVADRQELAGITMIGCAVLSAYLGFGLPDDRDRAPLSASRFTPLAAVRSGWHFVRANRHFPLLQLGNALFEGVFYGAIWFLMPLKIATESGGVLAGLTLGVYELVTLLGAAYTGYLADRYHWSRVTTIGWTLAAVGSVLLLFSTSVWWLVLVGAAVGVGNNLFAFAASHALEEHDRDHAEDGAFVGLSNLVTDLGYGIGPLLIGLAYAEVGFTGGLGIAAAFTVGLALWMIPLARRLARRGPARVH